MQLFDEIQAQRPLLQTLPGKRQRLAIIKEISASQFMADGGKASGLNGFVCN
jgi:hypothetical protein